jgi:type III pantothenate kinase
VGIDVGNTAIKVAFAGRDEVIVRRVAHNDTFAAVSRLLADRAMAASGIEARIASVNRAAANELISQAEALAGARIRIRRITRSDLPIRVATDHPERVGIDRIVGAFGATLGYKTPLVVVDAGTTTTVDSVDAEGVYRGGAIIPGLEMQTAALAAGTDALPRIDWEASCASPILKPGTNTIDGIRLGILSSVVGGIERLVRLYGDVPTVVVTGGDSECVATGLAASSQGKFEVHLHPHLVCRTLASLKT